MRTQVRLWRFCARFSYLTRKCLRIVQSSTWTSPRTRLCRHCGVGGSQAARALSIRHRPRQPFAVETPHIAERSAVENQANQSALKDVAADALNNSNQSTRDG